MFVLNVSECEKITEILVNILRQFNKLKRTDIKIFKAYVATNTNLATMIIIIFLIKCLIKKNILK
jgi:hypothetical protein